MAFGERADFAEHCQSIDRLNVLAQEMAQFEMNL